MGIAGAVISQPSRLLGYISRIGRRADERNHALRNRRFPSVSLPGREADAVDRGGRGSHIHKGRSGGDLNEQITSRATAGKDGDGGVGRGDGARAVNKSDPWELWCERGQRSDRDRARDCGEGADGDGV